MKETPGRTLILLLLVTAGGFIVAHGFEDGWSHSVAIGVRGSTLLLVAAVYGYLTAPPRRL